MRLDPSVYDLLRRYRFPGNIRELQNAVSVAYAFAEEEKVLRPEHFSETTVRPDLETASLPATPPSVFDRRLTLDALEREYILHVLNQHGGNRSLTAQALGIHANTLTRKLKQVSNV
jgi:transcriptional regulator with PAS, ATPase and Fis domain